MQNSLYLSDCNLSHVQNHKFEYSQGQKFTNKKFNMHEIIVYCLGNLMHYSDIIIQRIKSLCRKVLMDYMNFWQKSYCISKFNILWDSLMQCTCLFKNTCIWICLYIRYYINLHKDVHIVYKLVYTYNITSVWWILEWH